MIKAKINLKAIDKSKLFTSETTGNVYLDFVIIETPNSQYNDFMIKQDIGKEAREAGEEAPIIGDASHLRSVTKDEPVPPSSEQSDDLPF